MPEPLKGKKVEVDEEGGLLIYYYKEEPDRTHIINEKEFFLKEDVKSAVKWLIEEVENLIYIDMDIPELDVSLANRLDEKIEDIIKEAFEDVVGDQGD